MFNKDNKYKLNTSKPEKKAKKEKAEKAPKEKKEGGKLFGGRTFGKESGGKLSGAPKKERKGLSFDFLKRKEKEGKISNDFSKGGGKLSEGGSKRSFKERFPWLKWWHIVIAAVALVLIIAGIILAILISSLNNAMGDLDNPPEPEGTVTTVGTFTPNIMRDLVLCEYKEYFSGEKTVDLQRESQVRYNGKAYYVFVSENGIFHYEHSGEYTGEKTPEEVKAEVLKEVQQLYKYTDENIARCKVLIYQPVYITKVQLSSATLTSDNKVTMKYQVGTIGGDLSAEYTLNGTYTKNENNFTFAYTNLPDDANLRHVAEKLLTTAKYSSYDDGGVWQNVLTFDDSIRLYLVTAEQTE